MSSGAGRIDPQASNGLLAVRLSAAVFDCSVSNGARSATAHPGMDAAGGRAWVARSAAQEGRHRVRCDRFESSPGSAGRGPLDPGVPSPVLPNLYRTR